MKPFHQIVCPRPDVEQGVTDDSVYAASLSDLLHPSEASRRYWDSAEFDRLTYMTDGLRDALNNIGLRLHEGKGNGLRQIETSFGGGKTHAMIAMFHECRKWGAKPIVIDGGRLNASKQTIWGEIERQLDDTTDRMTGMVAPSEDEIYGLLHGRNKPILILMDEILPYVESAAGHTVGKTNMAVQTNTFMQRLSNKVQALPNVCVVVSLPDREDTQEKELYDHLKKVVGRRRQFITVADASDMPHILRRRLFETDESVIEDRAGENVEAYVRRCVEGKSIDPDNVGGYTGDFAGTYPFTPDVLAVLFDRWATYPSFQRTRGALRLLSTIVHSLLKSDRTEITLADIDLEVPAIRAELLVHTGKQMEGIINSDITGKHAGAREFRDAGMRAARAVFMYSFPRECKGATQAEVKRAASTSTVTHSEVVEALHNFQKSLFYLDLANADMYRFDTKENINKVIERAMGNVNVSDMEAHENERLRAAADGGRFSRIVVWPDKQTRIEDMPAMQLVILRENDPELCRWFVSHVSPKQGRAHSNALAFVMPTDGGKLAENIRRLLAMRRIRQTHGESLESNPVSERRVSGEESVAEGYIPRGLHEKYADVWLPDKDDGARRLNTMMADPMDDHVPMGEIMWDYLVRESEVHESFTRRMLDDEYGGDPDQAFRKMMTTPGERRPASLDVLRSAKESETEKPKAVVSVAGGRFVGGGDADRPDDDTGGGQTDTPAKHVEKITGIRCSCAIGRDELGRLGSVLATVRPLPTTNLKFSVSQRPDDKLDVVFDVDGDIDANVADSLRGLFPHDAVWTQTKDWDE
ncbi:MAG: ATP-binding protein [Thaumarchaeota archaeon]|nr:ATP-binding protein [Nitrososphaerota archaeon]